MSRLVEQPMERDERSLNGLSDPGAGKGRGAGTLRGREVALALR